MSTVSSEEDLIRMGKMRALLSQRRQRLRGRRGTKTPKTRIFSPLFFKTTQTGQRLRRGQLLPRQKRQRAQVRKRAKMKSFRRERNGRERSFFN